MSLVDSTVVGGNDKQSLFENFLLLQLVINTADKSIHSTEGSQVNVGAKTLGLTHVVRRRKLDKHQRRSLGIQIIENLANNFCVAVTGLLFNAETILYDTDVDRIPLDEGSQFSIRHSLPYNPENRRISAVLGIRIGSDDVIRAPVELRKNTVKNRCPSLCAHSRESHQRLISSGLMHENFVTARRISLPEVGTSTIHANDENVLVGALGYNDLRRSRFRFRPRFRGIHRRRSAIL